MPMFDPRDPNPNPRPLKPIRPKRVKPSKEDASGRMAQRGLSKVAGTKGRQMPRKPKALTPKQKEALDKMVPLKIKPSQKISKAIRGVVPKPKTQRKMG